MKNKALLHTVSIIACILCGILLCAAQTSLIPRFINDSYLVPDLLLCLTVALGMLGGAPYGAFFGIFAGILADSTGGFGISLLPLFYMLCGYGASVVAELIPQKRFLVYHAVGLIAVIGRVLVAVIYVMLSSGNISLLDVIRYVCFPLLLGSCLALPATYPLGLLLTLPIKHIKQDSIDKII